MNTWCRILRCSSYISKIVWWLPMFDFGIFCHLLRLMGIYRVRAPVRVFDVFIYLFLPPFLPFFVFCFCFVIFFSSFSLFLSLSRGPFSSGPLDIVHPCHPVATPLSVCVSVSGAWCTCNLYLYSVLDTMLFAAVSNSWIGRMQRGLKWATIALAPYSGT